MLMLWLGFFAISLLARFVVGRRFHLSAPVLPRSGTVAQRLLVALSAPLAFAALLLLLGFVTGLVSGVPVPASLRVQGVHDASPAAAAGLQAGDVLVTAEGRPMHSVPELQAELARAEGRPTQLQIERKGVLKTLSVTALRKGEQYRIGVSFDPTPRFVSGQVVEAARFSGRIPVNLLSALWRAMEPGDAAVRVEMASPVAIVQLAKTRSSAGHTALEVLAPLLMIACAVSLIVSLLLFALLRPKTRAGDSHTSPPEL